MNGSAKKCRGVAARAIKTTDREEIERLREALKLAKTELDRCTTLDPGHVPGGGDEQWVATCDVVARIHVVDDVICRALQR